MRRCQVSLTQQILPCAIALIAGASATGAERTDLSAFFRPPAAYDREFGSYKSLLRLSKGEAVRAASEWPRRRQELLGYWERTLGPWPPLLETPKMEVRSREHRENFTQSSVTLEIASGQTVAGYLLVPDGAGKFPGVVVPYYEPETSIGLSRQPLRDFGYQLARRGFVTLSIGSPGGDARKPELSEARCQPLFYLAYVAANCHTALARLPQVDPARIGIVGHSYGGKWAMFGACFYEKFACGVWSDPGIVFDERRPNVNYWEPWYLGSDPDRQRRPGVPTTDNPRTGAYAQLMASGHDLHEVLALMAPRPFLLSGGSEDTPERWHALNRVVEVYQLLGATNRVAFTNRPEHTPTPESNEQIYAFFERFLGQAPGGR